MNRLIYTCKKLLCLLSLLIAGCAYQSTRHDAAKLVPTNYGGLVNERSAQFVAKPEQDWWSGFNMPELDAMLTELEKANYDLEIARQRVIRSRALLGQQRSRNWPTLDASVTGTRTTTEIGQDRGTEERRLAFNAAYEVDLWGARSAANRAAELNVIAEHAQFRSAALTLQAQLALQYFELLSLQDRIDATQKNLKATEELLNLVTLRFNAGRVSGIELDQQRNILLTQRARLSVLERDRDLAEHALAVLLGRDKLLTVPTTAKLDDSTIPIVNVVQPAALLEARPDIVVAEANLKISDATVYQNRTKRWPTLQLSAEAALNDITRGNPPWTTSLIGQLTAPLFNAGRITNEIEAAQAEASIALKNYQLTVIRALQEVLDTLSDLNHQREIYAVRKDEVDTTKRLYDLARRRFDAGNIDFINLLDAQRTLFLATERVIAAKRDYLAATVNTFKAMGVPPVLLEPSELGAYADSKSNLTA